MILEQLRINELGKISFGLIKILMFRIFNDVAWLIQVLIILKYGYNNQFKLEECLEYDANWGDSGFCTLHFIKILDQHGDYWLKI